MDDGQLQDEQGNVVEGDIKTDSDGISINLSPEQLAEMCRLEEEKRQKDFLAEYEALCAKYGLGIVPQMQLMVVKLKPQS